MKSKSLRVAALATGVSLAAQPLLADQAFMVIRHKVADYAAWRGVFDAKIDLRAGAGELSALVLRSEADPNDLTLVMGWTSLDAARAYAGNPDLAKAMMAAGVMGPPEIGFFTLPE